MIGLGEIPPEAQRAVGYAGGGMFLLKMLDVLVKWRSGQRHDTLQELKDAVHESRTLRMDLRSELSATQTDLAAAELRAEEAEGENAALKHQLAATDRALASAVAELKTLRYIHAKCPAAQEA